MSASNVRHLFFARVEFFRSLIQAKGTFANDAGIKSFRRIYAFICAISLVVIVLPSKRGKNDIQVVNVFRINDIMFTHV